MDVLPQPTDPDAVQQLLWLRRDVMFLEFETAVRHCMTDTFLSAGNMQAYQVKTSLQLNCVMQELIRDFKGLLELILLLTVS